MLLDAENQVGFGWSSGIMTVPGGAATPLIGSLGYDLNPDFGAGATGTGLVARSGHPLRKSPFTGLGENVMVHVRVRTPFVANAGFPLVQFHAVLSTNQVVTTTDTFIFVGSSLGPYNIIATRQHQGYLASDLPADAQFFIRLNPLTARMNRKTTGAAFDPRDFRYLGLVMQFPNWDVGGGTYFSAGAVDGLLVRSGDVSQDASDFIMPSAVQQESDW